MRFFKSLLLTFILTLALVADASSASESLKKEIIIFDKLTLSENSIPLSDGVKFLNRGCTAVKVTTLPISNKNTKIKVVLKLVSKGNPWSKPVSCFIIPKSTKIDLTESEDSKLLPLPPSLISNYPGITADHDYNPCIELLRANAPFGVGFYSDSLSSRRPVYIPKWEREVEWSRDVSSLISELENEIEIGINIEDVGKNGFEVSLKLEYEESILPFDKKKTYVILPVINTIPYVPTQKKPDVFSKEEVDALINVPIGFKNAKLIYFTTGHGGLEDSDEFIPRENIIDINGIEVFKKAPWRDDCASFRRFNPHAGVTAKKTFWKDIEISERISSSDFSRSNWCPGSIVEPYEIPVNNLKSGLNSIRFTIPSSKSISNLHPSYWLVSAYLVGEL